MEPKHNRYFEKKGIYYKHLVKKETFITRENNYYKALAIAKFVYIYLALPRINYFTKSFEIQDLTE